MDSSSLPGAHGGGGEGRSAHGSSSGSSSTSSRAAPKCATPLSIVLCAAEVAPWSKTGGLGDVMGALPPALAARGHRVMVVAPRHTNGGADAPRYAAAAPVGAEAGRPVVVQLAGGGHELGFHHVAAGGVDWVFVDHPVFGRPGTPYGDARGPFSDNLFRFCLLALAALEAPLQLPLGPQRRPYGDDVVFVANDWHAAMLPVLLATRYQPGGTYRGAAAALAIHNMAHQGSFPAHHFNGLQLPGATYPLMEWRPPHAKGAPHAQREPTINVLKAGVAASAALVTVSPSYAREVTAAPQAHRLDTLLSARAPDLRGIVNGIDDGEWAPGSDPHTVAHFSTDDLRGKALCKRALQRELRLPPDPSAFLLGFVGRLDHQKGPDVVVDALPALAALGVQVVMLGTGAPDYEAALEDAQRRHGGFFRAHVGFSGALAHRIIAGCDALLMPSRFEPCGLNQLHALRYGTVPIVHATGGLADTVEDVDPFTGDLGNGFTFAPAEPAALAAAVAAAARLFSGEPAKWAGLMRRGMAGDYSWGPAAAQYEAVLLGVRARGAAAAGAGAAAAPARAAA